MGSAADSPLSYALLADGSSDRSLLPIIAWALRRLWKNGSFAAPISIARQHHLINEKIEEIVRQYRPDLVFVHRDAENRGYEDRLSEIPVGETTVPIIPVKMTEAWLLIDEHAIRRAAGNPNGRQLLEMPPITRLEQLPDPKTTLHESLKKASGNKGRRLRKFKASEAVHRLAELIDDYSALCNLHAFKSFYECLEMALTRLAARKSLSGAG